MYNLTTVVIVCVLINGLFKILVSVPIATNQANNTVGGRECKPLSKCDFYLQFTENDIAGLPKEVIEKELQRQTCSLDIHGKLKKGKCNLLILLLMNRFFFLI